jgi:small subunit ribosomal protein S24e
MEIIERKENPILNRVELSWQWRHVGSATPTRADIIDAVAKMEPGATKDRILVKSVSTRFGQPLTTGSAFVYSDRADLEKEPKYILARHDNSAADSVKEAPAKEAPAKEAPAEAAEIAGGEE